MASAAPILASTLGSLAVAKIGKSQGWDPMLTGILSAGVGLGAGGLTSGAFANAAAKAVPLQASNAADIMFKTTPSIALKETITPSLWSGPGAFHDQLPGLSTLSAVNGQPYTPTSISSKLLPTAGGPYQHPSYMDSVKSTFKGMFEEGGSGQNFLKSMGAQLVDAALAEDPPVQHPGGGGGGGGGSSPLGAPYQGGNGVSGQYKLVSAMPGRAQGIQWKGI